MKFKLDECMYHGVKALLTSAGHDAHTVFEEGLTSAPDELVWAVARREQRTLLTCDTDFCHLIRYPIDDTPGIIVLRGPTIEIPFQKMLSLQVISHLRNHSPVGMRWIVEPGRIREQEPPE
ncbi:MAG: DUF5615 family PIN-like protein [Phycisphaerae bacterium]